MRRITGVLASRWQCVRRERRFFTPPASSHPLNHCVNHAQGDRDLQHDPHEPYCRHLPLRCNTEPSDEHDAFVDYASEEHNKPSGENKAKRVDPCSRRRPDQLRSHPPQPKR